MRPGADAGRPAVAVLAVVSVLGACAPEAADTRTGAQLYSAYCAACHGERGEGDGPVAGVIRMPVPNLRTLERRNDGVFPTQAVTAYVDGRDVPAAHGSRLMPVWGDVFQWNEGADSERIAEARIDAVVMFLERLQYR